MSKIHNEDKVRDRISLVVEKLCDDLDLGWLIVTSRFDTANDGERVACECIPDWEYRQATLKWSLTVAATMTDAQLRITAAHELVHALIAPLWEEIPDKTQGLLAKHNELATENVARALLAALAK